jgi:hypothetical protein
MTRDEPAAAPNPALQRVRGAKAETDADKNRVERVAVFFIVRKDWQESEELIESQTRVLWCLMEGIGPVHV